MGSRQTIKISRQNIVATKK